MVGQLFDFLPFLFAAAPSAIPLTHRTEKNEKDVLSPDITSWVHWQVVLQIGGQLELSYLS